MHRLCTYVMLTTLFAGFAFAGGDTEDRSGQSLETIEPMTIKLAHVVNEQDGFHIAAVRFQELVQERTQGRVTIEIYPNAQLGDERTLLEGMQIGTVDMGVITNGPVANFVEEIAVFELPFLFPSPEAAYAVLDGPIGRELLDELERVQLKGLAAGEWRHMSPSEVKSLRRAAGL